MYAMRRASQDAGRGTPMRWRSWKSRTVGLCLVAALGGCQATHDWRNEADPIRGGGAPIPSGPGLPYPGRPSVDPHAGEVPPLQVGRPSTSPAALTIGTAAADDGRVPTTPAVTIQAPRPLGQAPATPTGTIQPMSGIGGSLPALTPTVGASFEQIQQALAARGVTEQHLDSTGKPDEWIFHCAIPLPNAKGTRRVYETKMVGPGGFAAMRAVLEQIDQYRR